MYSTKGLNMLYCGVLNISINRFVMIDCPTLRCIASMAIKFCIAPKEICFDIEVRGEDKHNRSICVQITGDLVRLFLQLGWIQTRQQSRN